MRKNKLVFVDWDETRNGHHQASVLVPENASDEVIERTVVKHTPALSLIMNPRRLHGSCLLRLIVMTAGYLKKIKHKLANENFPDYEFKEETV